MKRILPFALLPAALAAAAEPPAPESKPADAPSVAKAAADAKKPARRTLAQLEESKRALASELVQLTRVEQRLAAMAADSHAGLDEQIDRGHAGHAGAYKSIVEEYRRKLHAIVAEGFDWNALRPDIVKAHADAYTETELRELVTFFNSKIGKAFVEKNEKLGGDFGALTNARMQTIRPRIQSTFYELDLRLGQAAQQQQGQAPTQPPQPAGK